MTHDTFTEQISLWLDNELSSVEIAELQTHLASCLTCQQTYQAMQRVDTLLHRASTLMISPKPGFIQRFETRLVQHQAANGGHLWLGLGVLLLGTVFLFVVGGIVVSALISTGINLFGVDTLYGWLADFIESANTVGVWLNLAGLFVKASFITMSQPLFWGYALLAVGMAWLWLRVIKSVYRPVPMNIELLI
jgi:predicted anti-sigma-YlaC factor YlaD